MEPQSNSKPLRPIDSVKVAARDLPHEVVQARLDAAADDAANEKIAGPRIAAVLTACKLTLEELERLHARFADVTDLDLTGYSRGSALWLLSGRQLGLLRALLVQVEAGIANEAMITGRAIHEAARVLLAFSVPDEQDTVRIWLDDEGKHGYVKQGAARRAQERYERELNEAMERAGLQRIGETRALVEELYDRLSRVAHSRRSSVVDSLWESGRRMSYGIERSPIRRAAVAEWAASMTSEVANSVGDALRALYSGRDDSFFIRTIAPLVYSLAAVREMSDLSEIGIRRAAGTA